MRSLIEEERRRQDARWGGPAHDDHHVPEEWRQIITEHTVKAVRCTGTRTDLQRAIEVAALGFAVTEVLERSWWGRVPCENCVGLLDNLRALEQAASGVLAAQGTSGLDEAIAALRVALEGQG